MRQLFILRGLPGAGKSTIAQILSQGVNCIICEEDSFFMVYRDEDSGELVNRHQPDGVYEFDERLVHKARQDCIRRVKGAMSLGYDRIIVANTLTTYDELRPYHNLAQAWEYYAHTLVVENWHNGVSPHNVPSTKIGSMILDFHLKLY
jgi:predicted kinase